MKYNLKTGSFTGVHSTNLRILPTLVLRTRHYQQVTYIRML